MLESFNINTLVSICLHKCQIRLSGITDIFFETFIHTVIIVVSCIDIITFLQMVMTCFIFIWLLSKNIYLQSKVELPNTDTFLECYDLFGLNWAGNFKVETPLKQLTLHSITLYNTILHPMILHYNLLHRPATLHYTLQLLLPISLDYNLITRNDANRLPREQSNSQIHRF